MKIKKRLNLTQKIKKSNIIIDLVNDYFSVNSKKENRKGYIVLPRQIAMYLIKKNIDISYEEIGKLFKTKNKDKLDHATVMHACRKISNLIPFDKEIEIYIDDLKDNAKAIGSYNEIDLKIHLKKLEILNNLKDLDFNQLRNISIYIEQYYTNR
jgi:hypothetical protein